MPRRIFLNLTLLLSVACGPTLVFPGGELSGTQSAAPKEWKWTDEVSTVQLETRPEDPYSINIWTVASGDKLYVHAGANRSEWVEHIEANPSVKMRIEGKIYELYAYRVEDQGEFDAFSDGYDDKYDTRPRNGSVKEAYLFRLTAHPSP